MNNNISKVITFLTHSNIYLAIGITLTAYASSLVMNLNPEFNMLLIVFLMTFSLYTLNRKTDIKEDEISHPVRIKFFKKYGKIFFNSAFLSYIIAILISFSRNIYTVFGVLSILLLGIFYSVKLIPEFISKKNKFRRLKDIPIVKNLIVSITWAIAATVVPLAYSYGSINLTFSIIFLFVFMRGMINTISFDMRDTYGDEKEGIITIPILLGIINTKILLYLLNMILFVILISSSFLNMIPALGYFLSLSCLWSVGYIYMFDKTGTNKDLLCDIIIDGEMILIGLWIFIGEIITKVYI